MDLGDYHCPSSGWVRLTVFLCDHIRQYASAIFQDPTLRFFRPYLSGALTMTQLIRHNHGQKN